MFEPGEDTGDRPGEFQAWVGRLPLPKKLPFPQGYRDLRLNPAKGVLGVVTGLGTVRAAASVMALGLDPRFDLRRAYWLVAGIVGADPEDMSVGSAAWAEWLVDGASRTRSTRARRRRAGPPATCRSRPHPPLPAAAAGRLRLGPPPRPRARRVGPPPDARHAPARRPGAAGPAATRRPAQRVGQPLGPLLDRRPRQPGHQRHGGHGHRPGAGLPRPGGPGRRAAAPGPAHREQPVDAVPGASRRRRASPPWPPAGTRAACPRWRRRTGWGAGRVPGGR
jgi:hypothetical protein